MTLTVIGYLKHRPSRPARRLLDEGQLDCVEQGHLLVPLALQRFAEGDAAAAYATFGQVAKMGDRFGDRDLAALAQAGRGHALLRLGETVEGVALLDEAMLAVRAAELSPIVVGIVYCAVIEACWELLDLRRAQEWTAVLTDWCASQPDLVPFRGQCLVHRSQVMQVRGAWLDAMEAVRRARQRLSTPPGQPALGMAIYQQAELHRLCGQFAKAEEAYREASQWGHPPQPGLALLRLTQGRVDAAAAAIRRGMATSRAETAVAVDGGYKTLIGAASLAIGPLVMAVGDLLHPQETADIGGQAAIVAEQATRWYLAHLLLFIGLVLLVPGLLTLTDLAVARKPRVGYAARMLVLIGTAGVAAVFVAEMLAGRLGAGSAAAAAELLATMFSGPIAGPVMPVLLSFFAGSALFAVPLVVGPGPLRWPAVVFMVGLLLVLAGIISSQVLLSQIGNLLIWGGCAAFARLVVRGEVGAPAGASAGEALPAR